MSTKSYSQLINSLHRAPLGPKKTIDPARSDGHSHGQHSPECCGEAGNFSWSICIGSGTQPLRTCFSDKQGDVSDCRQLLQPCSAAQLTCASTCAHSQSPARAQQVIKFVVNQFVEAEYGMHLIRRVTPRPFTRYGVSAEVKSSTQQHRAPTLRAHTDAFESRGNHIGD